MEKSVEKKSVEKKKKKVGWKSLSAEIWVGWNFSRLKV